MAAEFAEFAKADKRQHGPKCTVCSLPPEMGDLVRQARKDGIQFSVIERFLKKKGTPLAQHTLARHFRDAHDEA